VLIDDAIQLSSTFVNRACEPSVFVMQCILCITWQLVDAILDDEGILELTSAKISQWPMRPYDSGSSDGTLGNN
jgi:hypothetical protein